MKILIILSCIVGVGYIDYQTTQIEKEVFKTQNYDFEITQEELNFEKQKFENKMKEFDNLIFKK